MSNRTIIRTVVTPRTVTRRVGPAGADAEGAGVSAFADLTDKASADLPAINTPLATALGALSAQLSGKAPSFGIAPSAISGTAVITTDPRLSDARTPTAHTHPASEISDATATGRSILTAANQAAARSSGLGSGATGDLLFQALTPAAARVVLEIERTRVTQSLDLSNATTTFVDTDLVFALQGGVDYLIRGQFDLVSTSGTGFRLQLLTSQNVNALATTANSLGWFALGGTVAPINSATLTTAEFANFTGSSTRRAQAEIRINLVATGTVRVRFAQNSGSAVPASVFKAGSFWTRELL